MKYTWLVEKYLEGELSGEALQRFELEILRNQEAARELERIRAMNHFMRDQHQKAMGKAELVEDFEDLENTLSEHEVRSELEGLRVRKLSAENRSYQELRTRIAESRSRQQLRDRHSDKVLVRRLSVALTAAALAILLLATGLLLMQRNAAPVHLAMYERYFNPPLADPAYRSDEQVRPSALQEALVLYGKQEYESAFGRFRSVPEESRSNQYYLYYGITAMQLAQFETAIQLFSHLETDPIYRHQSCWYTALSYLAMGEIHSATKRFNEILAAGLDNQAQAKAILRKI